MYIVQSSSETLQSIAKAIWGDSQLWYLIADANGIGSGALVASTALQVPARVTALHNDYQTYKPYDRSKLDGDLTPVLPPISGSGGCSPVFGTIVAIIVAVIVTYVTWNPDAGAFAFQAASAVTATEVVAGAVAGNIAGQLVNLADGAQDEFSWKSVALTAVSAGIAPNADTVLGAAASAAVSNAATQGVAILIHAQDHFDWRSVVASAAGGAVGQGVNIAGAAAGLSTFTRAGLASLSGGLTAAVARGGRISVQQIAVDAFGNAIGSSLAASTQPSSTYGATFAEDSAGRRVMNPLTNGGAGLPGEPDYSDMGNSKERNSNMLGAPDYSSVDETFAENHARLTAENTYIQRVVITGERMTPAQKEASLAEERMLTQYGSRAAWETAQFFKGAKDSVTSIPGAIAGAAIGAYALRPVILRR